MQLRDCTAAEQKTSRIPVFLYGILVAFRELRHRIAVILDWNSYFRIIVLTTMKGRGSSSLSRDALLRRCSKASGFYR